MLTQQREEHATSWMLWHSPLLQEALRWSFTLLYSFTQLCCVFWICSAIALPSSLESRGYLYLSPSGILRRGMCLLRSASCSERDFIFLTEEKSSQHVTSHHVTSHHITSHHITSHHITSHHCLFCDALCRALVPEKIRHVLLTFTAKYYLATCLKDILGQVQLAVHICTILKELFDADFLLW